jgi:hypothetical protein
MNYTIIEDFVVHIDEGNVVLSALCTCWGMWRHSIPLYLCRASNLNRGSLPVMNYTTIEDFVIHIDEGNVVLSALCTCWGVRLCSRPLHLWRAFNIQVAVFNLWPR